MIYASGEEYDGYWARGEQATKEEAEAAEAEDSAATTNSN